MVGILVFIYIISVFWSLYFVSWSVDKNIDTGVIVFTCLCPILNTMFAGYRTYRYFKNGGKFFIKDLFAD